MLSGKLVKLTDDLDQLNLPPDAHKNSSRGLIQRNPKQFGSPYFKLLGYKSSDHMLSELQGKKVLDLGSGHGVFALDILQANVDCEIYSLNPSYALPSVRAKISKIIKELFQLNEKDQKALEQKFYTRATAAAWDSLPWDNDQFDVVLSAYAYPAYCESASEVQRVANEIVRTCNKASEVRYYPSPPRFRSKLNTVFSQFNFLKIPTKDPQLTIYQA